MYEIIGELVFKSYMPKVLEKGMFFINAADQKIWTLTENIHPDQKEKFLIEHGAPVEPYILFDIDLLLLTPDQIGWWDEGPHTETLRDINHDDFNMIINDFEELISIQLEREPETLKDIKSCIYLQEGKAILSAPDLYEEDEEEEDEE